MRKIIDINYDWLYASSWQSDTYEAVNIPHTNKIIPYHYFDESIYQFKSKYKKKQRIEKRENEHIFLKFYGVQVSCIIYIDNKEAGRHEGGYDAFKIDITDFVDSTRMYEIDVYVDSYEDPTIPPFGGVVDYLTYGGIYREVELQYLPKVYLKDVFIYTTYNDGWYIHVQVEGLKGKTLEVQLSNLIYTVLIDKDDFLFSQKVENIVPWDLENPYLYNVKISLIDLELVDFIIEKIGFRTCEFRNDGFYLNNKKIKIRGLNRHQAYPYVGYAMPASMQCQDADILKYELGCNLVRTSHYPQSKHFIERCDEIGLLVFTELVGWQHVSKEKKWRDLVIDSCTNMILQYRNHPSIILWGVRVNESQDDDELYQKTNDIAHKLDCSRQTGGVRFTEKSNLLEDVYTYNDFSHVGDNPGLQAKKDVTSNNSKPYLVTEYNGHMYPTKTFDDEVHRTNHALRHACVLNAMMKDNEISGSIGWCMNDYNTHKDFGSGDRICYHGVMDMFRMPKLAASVYGSQQEEHIVLEVNSHMQIGDLAAGKLETIVVFTNCDSISLYKNDQFVKSFKPDRETYGSMNHPPIIIDDLIGNLIHENEPYNEKLARGIKELLLAANKYGLANLPLKNKLKTAYLMMRYHLTMQDGVDLYSKYIGNWGNELLTYRIEGIKDNKKVIEKTIGATTSIHYSVRLSKECLRDTSTYDVMQVFIEARDQYDNPLPYYFSSVEVQVEKGIEVYGPSSFVMISGKASCYLRSTGIPGTYSMKIKIEGETIEKTIVVD